MRRRRGRRRKEKDLGKDQKCFEVRQKASGSTLYMYTANHNHNSRDHWGHSSGVLMDYKHIRGLAPNVITHTASLASLLPAILNASTLNGKSRDHYDNSKYLGS